MHAARRWSWWIALAVSASACGKKDKPQVEPPKVAPSSAPIASTSASAAPVVTPTHRLEPASVTASSEFSKSGETHVAWDAFDGRSDSVWCPAAKKPPESGKGEWLEATFAKPQKVRQIRVVPGYDATSEKYGDLFVANAHVKTLRIDVDGGKSITKEIGEGERVVTIDALDGEVAKLRFTVDDVWPGKKWQDLSISEIEIIGDDKLAASASTVPGDVDDRLAKLAKITGVTKQPYDFLLSLGLPEPLLHEQQYAKVNSARITRGNLDGDPGDEALIEVSLAPPQESPPRPYIRYFYVLVDDVEHGRGVVGHRDFYTLFCGDEFSVPSLAGNDAGEGDDDDATSAPTTESSDAPSPSIEQHGMTPQLPPEAPPGNPEHAVSHARFEKVHSGAFDDVVIEWVTPVLCDDLHLGKTGAMVLTLERGTVDEPLHLEDTFRIADPPEKWLDPPRLPTFTGAPPKTIEIAEEGKPTKKLTIDLASLRAR